jgi:hypothetical protein
MIQYYINNRPVPRAIARHHLQQARPTMNLSEIDLLLRGLAKNSEIPKMICENSGVSVANI